MKIPQLTPYVRTPEDDARDAAEDAWKASRHEQDRRALVARIEADRRRRVAASVDAYAARTGSTA